MAFLGLESRAVAHLLYLPPIGHIPRLTHQEAEIKTGIDDLAVTDCYPATRFTVIDQVPAGGAHGIHKLR